jgi:hypothetical protein
MNLQGNWENDGMPEARQSDADRARRLEKGRCPVHGTGMGQIGNTDEVNGRGPSIVQCGRKACGILGTSWTATLSSSLMIPMAYFYRKDANFKEIIMHVKPAKTKNKLDQAIDVAYEQVKRESGIVPMDLFMVGLGFVGVGLSIVNGSWAPEIVKVFGGVLIAIGIAGTLAISRKL